MNTDPQKTYALVVGIEQYAAGPRWNLDGPASDARKFARWLQSRQVPAENIFLYLSPLAQNISPAEATTPEATRQNIYHTLTNVLPAKDDAALFYFFWGGHGMITPANERLLYYADATQHNLLNLDLNSLLTALRSDYFSSLDQQIFFIDTCANYVTNGQNYNTLPHETFSSGNQFGTREQFVCLATRPGERARNITQQQTGLFSQAVLEELAQQKPDRWPPDMQALTVSLATRFSNLRAEGKARQAPTHFWYKNWDGSEQAFSDIPVTTIEVRPVHPTLEPVQRRTLTRLLYACATVARRETRERMLKDLRYAIHANVLRDYQNDMSDIYGIIKTCLDYSGGLHEWIEIVRDFELDSQAMQQVDEFMEQVPPEL